MQNNGNHTKQKSNLLGRTRKEVGLLFMAAMMMMLPGCGSDEEATNDFPTPKEIVTEYPELPVEDILGEVNKVDKEEVDLIESEELIDNEDVNDSLYTIYKDQEIIAHDEEETTNHNVESTEEWALEKANYISSELDALGWKNILSQIGDPLLQAGGGGFYAKITADEGGVANVTIYIEGHDIFWIIYESNIGEGAHGARRHKQSAFSELHLISPTEVIVMHAQMN